MFLFTLILGLLFLPEDDTLECYECSSNSPGICTGTKCPSKDHRCLTAKEVVLSNGAVVSYYKGCFMPQRCSNFSINNGEYRWVQKSSCCDKDLCNAQSDYPEPDYNRSSNGRKCFTCVGENCMETLNCEGDENYCVTVTGNAAGISFMTKGCASEMACSNQSALELYQSALQYLGVPTAAKFSCCQDNYCNSASSASPALLLLMVPLLFPALFS